jgi:NADH-quinone oxidoreductase subunit H
VTPPIWVDLLKALVLLGALLGSVHVLVYLERKVSAGIQGRLGPTRVGPKGFLQPLADALKMIFKEDIVPDRADRFLYTIAPVFAAVPPVVAWSVIPFGSQMRIGDWVVKLQVADLDIGLLVVLAVLSTAVYGIAFGGWASANKYSLLGGLRASAQMVSYELTLSVTIVALMVYFGTANPREIVERQIGIANWNIWNPLLWPAAVLLYVSSLAENNRLPFDLPETEAELVGGYHTEYSSIKFSMFFMGEYIAVTLSAALFTTFFLGGWDVFGWVRPGDTEWWKGFLSACTFAIKTLLVVLFTMQVRWTLPRVRWTDLMNFTWKFSLEAAFLLVVVYGAWRVAHAG